MAILGPKTCLGVDIGARDIRVVELRRDGGRLEVSQAARIAIPEGGGVSSALSEFLLDTETAAGQVVGSLPTQLCSVKLAQIPKAKPADMARMVRFEAESQIPLPLADLVWDYSAESRNGDPLSDVVIGGARRADVERVLGVLEGAGAPPDAIMISALAALGAVSMPADGPVLLAQVGAEWSDFCVTEGGRLLACRTVRLGSEELTQAFAQDLNADADEAAEIRKTRGFSQLSALSRSGSSAVEGWAERLALEIRRSVVSMPSKEPDQRPQDVVIAGDLADVPGLVDDLTRRTGLRLTIGDPWVGMSVGTVAAHTLRDDPALFAVATGLAKAGLVGKPAVNLMPHHRAEERTRRRRELGRLLTLGGVAAVLLLMLLVGGPGLREDSAELSLLKSEVEIAQRDLQRAGPDLRASAGNVTQTVKMIESTGSCPLEILRQMSTVLPRSIWLSEFAFEYNKAVVIKGTALSNAAVADAVDVLNQLDLFKDVTLDFSNLAKNSQTYEFQVTCSMPTQKGIAGRTSVGKSRSSGGKTGIVVQ